MKRKLDMSNQTYLRFDHVNRKPTSIHMFCGSDEFPNDFKIKRQIFTKLSFFVVLSQAQILVLMNCHP